MSHQPIQQAERIEALDIIRGFALLGILMVNMTYFSTPIVYTEILGIQLFAGSANELAESLISIFFEGSFYTLFSLLFGIGFMIFMERAEQKGIAMRTLYLRRVFILLIFGLIHLFLIWFGDILTVYALVGALLLFFYRRSNTTLIVWAALLMIGPVLLMLLLGLTAFLLGDELYPASFLVEMKAHYENSMLVFAEGSYAEIFAQRLIDITMIIESTIFVMPSVLAMFLLGVYIWRKGLLQNLPQSLSTVRKIWTVTLLIAAILSILAYYISSLIHSATSFYHYVYYAIGFISGPALAIFFFASILLLLQKELWRKLLGHFQALGRMALTNYIMQSLLCTFIFYGYGLGLYGKIGPALSTLIAILIILLQIILSKAWFSKFHYGPLEWVWRYAIYGKKALVNRQ